MTIGAQNTFSKRFPFGPSRFPIVDLQFPELTRHQESRLSGDRFVSVVIF